MSIYKDKMQSSDEKSENDSSFDNNTPNDALTESNIAMFGVNKSLQPKFIEKIYFKYAKPSGEKKHRTYVFNLRENVNSEKMPEVIKLLKKSLGTSHSVKILDDKETYSFCGDLKDRIMRILINNNVVTKDAFKK